MLMISEIAAICKEEFPLSPFPYQEMSSSTIGEEYKNLVGYGSSFSDDIFSTYEAFANYMDGSDGLSMEEADQLLLFQLGTCTKWAEKNYSTCLNVPQIYILGGILYIEKWPVDVKDTKPFKLLERKWYSQFPVEAKLLSKGYHSSAMNKLCQLFKDYTSLGVVSNDVPEK